MLASWIEGLNLTTKKCYTFGIVPKRQQQFQNIETNKHHKRKNKTTNKQTNKQTQKPFYVKQILESVKL